jgi:universal stress protein A
VIDKILVAVDGSARAPGVIQAAAQIAVRFRATLTPFRAILIPPEFPPAARASHLDPLAVHLEAAAIADLRELTRPLVGVRLQASLVAVGQPWRAILECAEGMNADLIVIGSHGYHFVDHLLGTTAAKVVNLARQNVFVVHSCRSDGSDAVQESGQGATVDDRE